jgi:hypothetical protein
VDEVISDDKADEESSEEEIFTKNKLKNTNEGETTLKNTKIEKSEKIVNMPNDDTKEQNEKENKDLFS